MPSLSPPPTHLRDVRRSLDRGLRSEPSADGLHPNRKADKQTHRYINSIKRWEERKHTTLTAISSTSRSQGRHLKKPCGSAQPSPSMRSMSACAAESRSKRNTIYGEELVCE